MFVFQYSNNISLFLKLLNTFYFPKPMLEIVTYGICVVIFIVLVVALVVFSGPALLLFLTLFPSLVAGWITRERVDFMTNYSPKHSSLFYVITVFLVGLEVMVLGGFLYLIYKTIALLSPAASQTLTTPHITLSNQQVTGLLALTVVLALFTVYQTIMTVVNFFRFRDKIKNMTWGMIMMGYVAPIVVSPIAGWFLYVAYTFLSSYSANYTAGLAWHAKAAASISITYYVVSLGWTVYTYFFILKKHNVQLGFGYWSGTGLSLLHRIAFIYLTIHLFLS
jgi:hypothetical protein